MKILRNVESAETLMLPWKSKMRYWNHKICFDFPKWKMHSKITFLIVYNESSFWSNTLRVLRFFSLIQCGKHILIYVSLHIIGFWVLFSMIGLEMTIPLYTEGKYFLKRLHNSVINFTDFLQINHLSWAYNYSPRLPMPWNPSHSSTTTIIHFLLHKWASWWFTRQRICLQCRRHGFDPWVRKIPWRRDWLHTLVFLPGEFHGQRSLVG